MSSSECHLCIREQEDSVEVLHSGHLIKLLQIIVERVVVIATAQLNLETPVGADVCRESCQGLLTGTTHADQQCVTTLLTNDSHNPVQNKTIVGFRKNK